MGREMQDCAEKASTCEKGFFTGFCKERVLLVKPLEMGPLAKGCTPFYKVGGQRGGFSAHLTSDVGLDWLLSMLLWLVHPGPRV